jgi:hypothetical protein
MSRCSPVTAQGSEAARQHAQPEELVALAAGATEWRQLTRLGVSKAVNDASEPILDLNHQATQ